jgi:hypothetical protein
MSTSKVKVNNVDVELGFDIKTDRSAKTNKDYTYLHFTLKKGEHSLEFRHFPNYAEKTVLEMFGLIAAAPVSGEDKK